MLNCRKCKSPIENRLAHQSYYDLEQALAAEVPATRIQHKVRILGPLCDVCLSEWLTNRLAQSEVEEVAVPDMRSAAIRKLDAACQRLALGTQPGVNQTRSEPVF